MSADCEQNESGTCSTRTTVVMSSSLAPLQPNRFLGKGWSSRLTKEGYLQFHSALQVPKAWYNPGNGFPTLLRDG